MTIDDDPELKELAETSRTRGVEAGTRRLQPSATTMWRQPRTIVAALAALVVVGAVVVLGLIATAALRTANSAKDGQAANASALAQANSQLVRRGGTAVATPAPAASPEKGDTGATGATGPAPTTEQVASAVAVYCAEHSDCRGTPSRTQVQAAVVSYCAADACRGTPGGSGASGAPGPAGASGASGAAGRDGMTPSPADVTAAISAYCDAHGGCTGPAGPKGDAGVTGRGITSIDCAGLGVDQLVIHYDDGTTETVACNAGVATSGDVPTSTETP